YIDDNACTDLLNQSLKQMCPSLYTNENAIFSKACEKLKQALNIKNDSYERDRLLKEAVELVKQIGYVANLGQVCDMLHTAGCYEAIFELCITAAEKRDPQNIALYYYRKNEPPEDIQGQHYYQLRTECYKSMLDCLNNLVKTPSYSLAQQKTSAFISKEKLEEEINYLIRYVVNSKDELAQVSLFNWMVSNGFEKKLVTLDSTFLEFYLIRQYENQSKNRIYLDLLWRHYDYKKDYIKASKVLITLAEKESATSISLRERVEYLTQAIVALNSSQKSSVKDEIAELNDRKDVALLQERIFEELGKIEPRTEAIQEAMGLLDSRLYDITKLFYEFAEKFELSQYKLAIFKMSRHEDPNFIEIFWKQIVANENDKLNRPDMKPSDLKHELAENIILIAKDYIDDEKYFPLNLLIDSLEFVSLARGFEPEWCCSLLRRLNLPFEQLIQAYNEVYLKKDIKWAENSSRFINGIYCLIELFTKAPRATSETDK
ncbi:nuclear pore complex protein Nup155-like, partial [Brachionus plicatilis]